MTSCIRGIATSCTLSAMALGDSSTKVTNICCDHWRRYAMIGEDVMGMRSVLCFGDSNTFGYDPQGVASGTRFRYPVDVRWPGVLQGLLGPDWRIVEEGLCGRTTVHRDPFEGGLCGLDELPVALASAQPIDCIVLMLGTNDMKTCFNLAANDIARGVESLVLAIKRFPWAVGCWEPMILVVSPPHIGEGVRNVVLSSFGEHSVRVSHEVAEAYRVVADEQGCAYLDASKVCEPSPIDHIHMTPQGHGELARAVAKAIGEMFSP